MNISLAERIIKDQRLEIETLQRRLGISELNVKCFKSDKLVQRSYIAELESKLLRAEAMINFDHYKLRADIADLYHTYCEEE